MPTFAPVSKENQLIIGNPEARVAVCTLWTPREVIAKHLRSDSYCAIGNLYNGERGVQYLLRNLARNPQVSVLIVTGEDKSGSGEYLLSFFKGHRQLVNDMHTVNTLCREVQVIDARGVAPERLQGIVDSYAHFMAGCMPWGEPFDIPEPPVDVSQPWPAPDSGHVIRGGYVAEVWYQLLHDIWHFGRTLESGYDAAHKELLNLVTVIEKENTEDFWLPEWMGVSSEQLNQYLPQVLYGIQTEGVKYTYGERMRSWFRKHVDGQLYHGEIDQVHAVVKKLRAERISKSAVISLWDPAWDNDHSGSPCLNHLWFRIRDEALYLTATIRSNDMVQAYPLNALSLRTLQQYVATQVDADLGSLTIVSQSAHIYEHDYELVQHVIEDTVIKKEMRGKQDRFFDPRGNFVIAYDRGEIIVEHVSPDSSRIVQQFRARHAIKMIDRLAEAGVITSHRHSMYIGAELQKAEMLKERYVQDR